MGEPIKNINQIFCSWIITLPTYIGHNKCHTVLIAQKVFAPLSVEILKAGVHLKGKYQYVVG